jgi:hypothetical protein
MRRGGHSDIWTAPLITCLTKLHGEGKSFSEMADALNQEFSLDLTRNACIGKSRRLGLPLRELPALALDRRTRARIARCNKREERRRAKSEVRIKPAPPTFICEPEPARPPLGSLHMNDLREADCRWIHIAKPQPLFCGRPKWKGSYCADHYSRCYYAPRVRW